MALQHAPGEFSSKVISVDSTLLLVYIYNSAGVCCHGIYIIYYNSPEILLVYKIYMVVLYSL